ncbi:hypothetical protein [Mucilaginibacter sp. UR6-11]|uniref:hypothetical protein n=1 Tax=Mucilaginibacter sp. UR6-11 TaxID=1435644 RepID=UPI001E2A715B|nr:hypothetical protein [Mucilaginibacter sp. UR6-11]MCC8425478.1 hypothetical protein [Mucilaginibacter sp. UR6-11]
MENSAYSDPKDDQITNDDTSVTNKDGDNDLEKGEPSTNEADSDAAKTPTPDDNIGDPTPRKKGEDASNKGAGPKGEAL